MALFKIALCLALLTVCYADDWTKCKPNPKHVEGIKECVKSELGKVVNSKEEMKELHKSSSDDDQKKVMVCAMKKKGILNDKDEYVEAKAIECAKEIETTPEIQTKLVDGVKKCGEGMNAAAREDQIKIFLCTKELFKKECH